MSAVLAGRAEGDGAPRTRLQWASTIAYWVFTIVVAFEMLAGGIWDLLRIDFVRVSLVRLGYPLYLLYILGIPKIACAVALLVPRFPRLKEWAYAGAFFDYMGAAASWLMTGNRAAAWVAPLVFAALTLCSWALRPPTRKLVATGPTDGPRAAAWWVPVLILLAMVVVSFLTLPTGPPPQ